MFWQDFILEHYSEDSTSFQDEIDDLMDLRKVLSSNNNNSHTSSIDFSILTVSRCQGSRSKFASDYYKDMILVQEE